MLRRSIARIRSKSPSIQILTSKSDPDFSYSTVLPTQVRRRPAYLHPVAYMADEIEQAMTGKITGAFASQVKIGREIQHTMMASAAYSQASGAWTALLSNPTILPEQSRVLQKAQSDAGASYTHSLHRLEQVIGLPLNTDFATLWNNVLNGYFTILRA